MRSARKPYDVEINNESFVTSALEPPQDSPQMGHTSGHDDTFTLFTVEDNDSIRGLSADMSKLGFSIVIGSLFFGTFLVALDTTIIGTAAPAITTAFHALEDIGWYGSGYLLTLTAFQPTFGKIYTLWDIKTIYLLCVIVFEGMFPFFTIYTLLTES